MIYVIVILVLLVLYTISVYNSLIKLRMNVKNGFSQIDVQLKRRFDLIPNLVETIKGFTKHEKETLESVINARNTYLNANSPEDKINANTEAASALTRLFALSESYPELKADKSFVNMQEQLKDTEDKIGYARQFYNDYVAAYNRKTELFPSNIIANLFNFKQEAFFEADDDTRENIKVKFD